MHSVNQAAASHSPHDRLFGASILMRFLCRSLWGAALAAFLAPIADVAQAQGVDYQIVEETETRVVYEFTASWDTTLQAAAGPGGASVTALLRGGLFELTLMLRPPSLALPLVRVLAADFDEMRVEIDPEERGRGPAEVVGLGLERKKPAATLVARLITYDPGSGMLRRYRRLRLEVTYGAGGDRPGRSFNSHMVVSESVLATGTVFKIPIREEGIYRIDAGFLNSLPDFDQDVGAIDPRNVKVYGNGGAPVPALNGEARAADLVENQVFVFGGGDGSFDEGDAVWFYGAPPAAWRGVHQTDNRGRLRYDESGRAVRHWEHYVHPFSNDNYYFIKIDDVESDHLSREAYPELPGATLFTEVVGRHFVDMDEVLWGREGGDSGHTWVSNLIRGDGGPLPILDNVMLPGLVDGRITYRGRTAVQSNPSASIFFKSGAATLASANYGTTSTNPTTVIARSGIEEFEQDVSRGQALNIELELQNQIGGPEAALDWLRVLYPMGLHADGGPVRFHTPLTWTGVFEATLLGFGAEPYVLDVTEIGAYAWLGAQASGGGRRVQVGVSDEAQPRELIAFAASDVRAIDVAQACPPDPGCRVAPQNLHGVQTWPDFVIVAPEIFATHAEELADIRREEGLVVEVVDIEDVFNEFSGGLRDIRGLRDYLKFLYDRAPGPDELLRYALFFGDGHFNYRELGAPPEFTNWIPPFETEESWNPEVSYTTDDYFGLLDDNEGLWPFTRTTFFGSSAHLNERVDIGIGRFTVTKPSEAQVILDKIKHYESPDTFGPWRKRYLFIADDGPTGSTGAQDDKDLHTQNTDVVAVLVDRMAPDINQKKVYAISYPREFRSTWGVPRARQDVLTAINDGVLVVNFSGHGSEDGLAQENLFTIDDAVSLRNYDMLPVFITATCSFGRWDRAHEQSGAEELLLNPDGGAIALLTTVRTVYTSGDATSLNVGLNVALNAELFRRDAQGFAPRLGDALRLTKNKRVGYEGNNRKFNLLGDPSMRLGTPSRKAVVTAVNDMPEDGEAIGLQALGRVKVTGEVRLPDGGLDASFDGAISVTVFDSKRRIAIPDDIRRYMPTPYYVVQEDLIWRGRTKVDGGRFEAMFVVPKDISYSNKEGRISVYAYSSSEHAQGITDNVIVGGTAADAPDDDEGPVIELFLGDETFTSGGLTSPMPQVIAKLYDESGINTIGAGVGHEMLLILDEDERSAVNIGGLYESEENSYQRGQVTFSFEDRLDPGQHSLSMRAWDVINNSATSTLEFVVTESEALLIRNVFNYPNPTTGPTRFVFEHNQAPGTPVEVQVRIYTLAGRPVRTIEHADVLPGGAMQVIFDGADDDYVRLAPGVYLYKVRVEIIGVSQERQISEAIERLAIVR